MLEERGANSLDFPKSQKEESFRDKISSEDESSDKKEFWIRIENEKLEAKEKFAEVIDFVNKRYEGSELSPSFSLEQLEAFKEHNEQVLDKCIERGIERNLDKEELAELETAAILHDLNKVDSPPNWLENIDNAMLVYHGEAASEELAFNEELREILKNKFGEENFEKNILHLQNAIRSHMGPHPGFMSEALRVVNEQLKIKEVEPIEHPHSKEGDKVAEILLAVDMYSLASPKGVQKVVTVRSETPVFKAEDEKLVAKYAQLGIDLDIAEAAVLSAFDSACAARDMIKNKEDKEWIEEAIEETVGVKYVYKASDETGQSEKLEKPVSIKTAQEKRKLFEDKQKVQKIQEEIRGL
jgi:hypothetical protein